MSCDVVTYFCGGLRGEEVFLTSLKGMLKFWEEKRMNKSFPHILVALKAGLREIPGRSGICCL